MKTTFRILLAALILLPTSAFAKWPFYFFGPVLQDAEQMKDAWPPLKDPNLFTHAEAEKKLCSLVKANCKLNKWDVDIKKRATESNDKVFDNHYFISELRDSPNDQAKINGYWVQYYNLDSSGEMFESFIHQYEWNRSFITSIDGTRTSVEDSFSPYTKPSIYHLPKKLLRPYWMAEDVTPKVFDGNNRVYWLKLFSPNGTTYWLKKNTYVVTPQYSRLNYEVYDHKDSVLPLDQKKTAAIFEKLLPEAATLLSNIKQYEEPQSLIDTEGKLVPLVPLPFFPTLYIVGSSESELELGILLTDFLWTQGRLFNGHPEDGVFKFEDNWGFKSLNSKCKIPDGWDRTNPQAYWISQMAEKKSPKHTFKVKLSHLKEMKREGYNLTFDGGTYPIDFEYKDRDSEEVKARQLKGEKITLWDLNPWYIRFQKSIEDRYFMRKFTKEEYDQMMKEADQKISEACKNEPTKKVP